MALYRDEVRNMKKTLIFILTFITLISVLSVSAFAEDSSAELSDIASSEEASVVSEDSTANDVMIPYESVDVPHEKPEKPGKPGKHEGSEESIPTIGAITESSEASKESVTEEGVGDVELKFTTENMSTSLTHMGLGLLGVMIVLGLIAVVVVILNKASKKD